MKNGIYDSSLVLLFILASLDLGFHSLYGCLSLDRLALPEKPFGTDTTIVTEDKSRYIEAVRTLSPELVEHIANLCAIHSMLRNDSNANSTDWMHQACFSNQEARRNFIAQSNRVLRRYPPQQGLSFLLVICVLRIPNDLLCTQMNALMQKHRNLDKNLIATWPSDVKERYNQFYDACNTDNKQVVLGILRFGAEWGIEIVIQTGLDYIVPLLGTVFRVISRVRTAKSVLDTGMWIIDRANDYKDVEYKFIHFKTRDGGIFLIETTFREKWARYRGDNSARSPHELLVTTEEFIRIVQLIREIRQIRSELVEPRILYALRYHPQTIVDAISPLGDVNMNLAIDSISRQEDWDFFQKIITPLQALPGVATPEEATRSFNQVWSELNLPPGDTRTKLLFAKVLADRWKINATDDGENIIFSQKQVAINWMRSLANYVPSWLRRLWC